MFIQKLVHTYMREKIMKDLTEFKENQKVRIITTNNIIVEGTVLFLSKEEEEDYELAINIRLDKKSNILCILQSEIKDIVVLDQNV